MHINKLEIKGFGKLKESSLNFTRGMNLVYGTNEAGKSTVQQFIKAMLYGLKGGKASGGGMPSPIKRYAPWDGSSYGGAMEYTLESEGVFRVTRNFDKDTVEIFDSSFNDITGTFDKSRGKGVLFAQKQLGLTENCFEKTAFVKQMETRIGNDGSKELLDRLSNVTQTGFQDVSFNRAQKALKEALKNHVGTEKTSVRPLDMIIQRLEKLKAERPLLIERNKEFLDRTLEYNSTVESLAKANERMEKLKKARTVREIQENIDKKQRRKASLKETCDNVNGLKVQINEIKSAIEELAAKEKELVNYSTFTSEDGNRLSTLYYSFLEQSEGSVRSERELNETKRHKTELESHISEKGISVGSENDYKRAVELSRELKSWKEELEELDVELLGEKVIAQRERKRNRLVFASVSIIVFIISIIIGFLVRPEIYAIALAAFAVAVWFGISFLKASRLLDTLTCEKRSAFITATALKDKTLTDQNGLDNILKNTGAKDIEDLLSIYTEHDREIYKLNALNEEISQLESESKTFLLRAEQKQKEITEILIGAGIKLQEEEKAGKEHIEEFTGNLKEYGDVKRDISYLKQRKTDFENSLELQLKRVESLCSEGGSHSLTPEEQLLAISDSIKGLEARLEEMNAESGEGYTETVPKDIEEQEYLKTEKEIDNLRLKATGLETLLNSNPQEGSELQQVEEEICELEEKKAQLEDKYFSIKTALDTLVEASGEIQKDFAPVLNKKMSTAIERITGSRYSDIRAGKGLSLKVLVPETGQIADNPVFSGGTVDQLYMALRVAMADIISCSREKIPFIMDEVFAQYDDSRVRNTLEFLKDISEERQVILFTCKSREVDIAKQIFNDELNVIGI